MSGRALQEERHQRLVAQLVLLERHHVAQVEAPQDATVVARVQAEHFADRCGHDEQLVEVELVATDLLGRESRGGACATRGGCSCGVSLCRSAALDTAAASY